MSTYTIDEENIYFLNDKNIASSLSEDKVNAIPSLDLVGNLSATVDDISSNLVYTLKGYANGISSELSGTINANRKADKAELSGVLSTYTDTKILQLSTDLSTQVDSEFVHISGDIIDHLVVTNGLSVAQGSIVIDDSKIAIRDNLNIAASNSNIDLTSKIVDVTALSALAINCAENDFKINGESLKDIKAGLSAAMFEYNHDQKSLYLKFSDNRILSVDATRFIKDGMISSVTYDEHMHIVHIVWNTDAGIDATDINLSGLIDTYYAGDGLYANAETPNIFQVDYDKVASRERLDGVLSSVSHAIKLEGHPWLDPKYSGEITILDSNLLGRHIDADPDGMLKNGLALHITLSGDPNTKFEILPRPEVKDVDDSIFVGNDDIIVVHAHHSGKLSPDEIFLTGANKSIYVFRASVPRYEFASLSTDHETKLSILSNNINEVSIGLSTAITDVSVGLSTAISSKIFISSYLPDDNMSGYADLSIVKLPKDEFDDIIGNTSPYLSANTLYIVDSDYIDAYGQAISNVVMDDLSGKTPSEATNKTYVDAKIDETKTYVDNQITTLSNVLSAISNAIITDPVLSNGINIESDLSTVISAVVLLFKQLRAI